MSKNRSNYEKTAYYRGLMLEHTLDEYGVWEVRGEDQNCDLGGSHHMPFLGRFEGTLSDIIDYAVDLPNFWTWGGGGEIRKSSAIKKIDNKTNIKRKKLQEEYELLSKKLEAIKKEIDSL